LFLGRCSWLRRTGNAFVVAAGQLALSDTRTDPNRAQSSEIKPFVGAGIAVVVETIAPFQNRLRGLSYTL